LAGEVRCLADAARFTDCRTGDSLPIAMEPAYLELERAYLAAVAEPGAPLYVTFEGAVEPRPKMEDDGEQPTVVVTRFIRVWPEESCDRARVDASLLNTYWRVVRLGDEEVVVAEGHREPHLVLRGDGESPRFSATAGCNQLAGGLVLEGQTIAFGPAVATMMACPPPLEELERSLGLALGAARSWRVAGNTLELLDEAGASVALLQAVYL
jgi:heat shock protein HslJ